MKSIYSSTWSEHARPGIDKYKDVYQPEDIPSSKPPPEPPRNKFLRAGALFILAVLLIGGPVYYYVSQHGFHWFRMMKIPFR